MKSVIENKKGIASFYVVAFSTLILLVIAVSFASLVVSQMERSSNADLSQSAYDAAMAGVEDAKLAYMNYRNCKKNPGANSLCGDIIRAMEVEPSCNMVSVMLGRDDVSSEEGVMIREGNADGSGNNMQQYYTCVKINSTPSDQEKTVSVGKPMVFKPEFENVSSNDIKLIKVDWGENNSVPSNLSLAIVQTPGSFQLDDFTYPDNNGGTNVGTVFLLPCPGSNPDLECTNETIMANDLAKSNNKTVSNKPVNILCSDSCSATIVLPDVYNYNSNDIRNELEIVVTSFGGSDDSGNVSIMYCKDGSSCSASNAALISNQFVVDSTGRASNLFKRVRVTLDVEGADESAIAGPLILGDGGLLKNFSVSTEHSNWGDGGEQGP